MSDAVSGGAVTGGAASHIPSYIHFTDKLEFPEEELPDTPFEGLKRAYSEQEAFLTKLDELIITDPDNMAKHLAALTEMSKTITEYIAVRKQRDELVKKFYKFLPDGQSAFNKLSEALTVQNVVNPADPKLDIYRVLLRAINDHHAVAVIKRGDSYEFFNPWGPGGFDELTKRFPKAVAELEVNFGTPLSRMIHNDGTYQCRSAECETVVAFRLANSHLDESTLRGLMSGGISTAFESPREGTLDKKIIDGIWRYFADRFSKNTNQMSVHSTPATSLKKGGLVPGAVGAPKQITAHGGELVVPVDTVKAVLRSSAWIDHVKRVQKQHGVSYKAALSLAANIPRGSV